MISSCLAEIKEQRESLFSQLSDTQQIFVQRSNVTSNLLTQFKDLDTCSKSMLNLKMRSAKITVVLSLCEFWKQFFKTYGDGDDQFNIFSSLDSALTIGELVTCGKILLTDFLWWVSSDQNE